MKYEILVSDRKAVVKKIEELTGIRPSYTGLPELAYTIEGIVIANDNTLTADDDADPNLVVKLIESRMIRMIPGELEDGDDDWGDDEEDEMEEDRSMIKPEISFPMDGHRKDSIVNLVCTIFSKGALISKSTGGTFTASGELVKRLHEEGVASREDAIRIIEETEGGLVGISFSDGKVNFDGFPETDSPDEVRAWTGLSAAINKNAIEQKHVRANETDVENEKYAFRTWLTRLGMKGADTKEDRKLLYRKLDGHTAFRTEADREKWKAAMKARKEAGSAEAGSVEENAEER